MAETLTKTTIGRTDPETLSSIARHFEGTKDRTLINGTEDGIMLITEKTEPRKMSFAANLSSEDLSEFSGEEFTIVIPTGDLYDAVREDGFYDGEVTLSVQGDDFFVNDVRISGEAIDVDVENDNDWLHPNIAGKDAEIVLSNGYLLKEWFRDNTELRGPVTVYVSDMRRAEHSTHRFAIRPYTPNTEEIPEVGDDEEPSEGECWVEGRLRHTFDGPFEGGHVYMDGYTDLCVTNNNAQTLRPTVTNPEDSVLKLWTVYDGSLLHKMFTRVLKEETEGVPYKIEFDFEWPITISRTYGEESWLEMILAPEFIGDEDDS